MKLWIDDIRKAPDDTWEVAMTNTEAAHKLYMFATQFDEISIDHDAGNGETFIPSAMIIGLVRNWLLSIGVVWKPTITIHSQNPDGVPYLQEMFNEYGMDTTIPKG